MWVTNKIKVENGTLDVRAYPSAGALYPIKVYVVANNVEYLKKGVYHYNVTENCLEYILNLSENDFQLYSQIIDFLYDESSHLAKEYNNLELERNSFEQLNKIR